MRLSGKVASHAAITRNILSSSPCLAKACTPNARPLKTAKPSGIEATGYPAADAMLANRASDGPRMTSIEFPDSALLIPARAALRNIVKSESNRSCVLSIFNIFSKKS